MIKIFGLLILLGSFSGFCGSDTGRTGDSAMRFYGEKTKFWQNQPVKFTDLSITYIGERQVSSDKFPRGFLYRDFKVQSGKEEQTISWSSGTGDIAPTAFTIGGKSYELELVMSDKLGKLAADELIVWKK
jgi:hypothetical protein